MMGIGEELLDEAAARWGDPQHNRQGFHMNPDHPQWDAAWQRMAAEGVNDGLPDPYTATCPRSGEGWQYMGSYIMPSGNVHEFRHRHHPAVNRRVITRVFIPAR